MTRLHKSGLIHKAVYWAASGNDEKGRMTLSAPVEIPCRWTPTFKNVTDAQGRLVLVTVILKVKQEIADNSILWKGNHPDLPDTPTNLFQVVGRKDTDDVKGRQTRRKVFLKRYSNTLPALA